MKAKRRSSPTPLSSPNLSLKPALDLLDAGVILDMLDPRTRALITGVEVLRQTGSTNSRLMRQGASGYPAGQVCLAELQTVGRGRAGKRWISPFGANLYMSLLWRFKRYPAHGGCLSLLTGLTIADALTSLGAQGLGVKWPNDLLWQGRKLAGILVEGARGADGAGYVVIGVGVNVRMPESAGVEIDQPWTDVAAALHGDAPARNLLAARLLDRLVPSIRSFDRSDRTHLRHAWHRYDCTYGQIVELRTETGRFCGTAMGVDAEGRLLLEINGRREAFTSGDVSLSFEREPRRSGR